MEDFLRTLADFQKVLGDSYFPYLAIYLLYRYLLRPLRDELRGYFELKKRQADSLDGMCQAISRIERLVERLLAA